RMPRIGLLMCSLMLLLERKRVLSGNDSEERHSSNTSSLKFFFRGNTLGVFLNAHFMVSFEV
uniref:Uncharacterized protein n=1 Tax=Aegilops tauschii subsp. strangulata TaxID=200361 RepID=A0A453L1R4_AEGTS